MSKVEALLMSFNFKQRALQSDHKEGSQIIMRLSMPFRMSYL